MRWTDTEKMMPGSQKTLCRASQFNTVHAHYCTHLPPTTIDNNNGRSFLPRVLALELLERYSNVIFLHASITLSPTIRLVFILTDYVPSPSQIRLPVPPEVPLQGFPPRTWPPTLLPTRSEGPPTRCGASPSTFLPLRTATNTACFE